MSVENMQEQILARLDAWRAALPEDVKGLAKRTLDSWPEETWALRRKGRSKDALLVFADRLLELGLIVEPKKGKGKKAAQQKLHRAALNFAKKVWPSDEPNEPVRGRNLFPRLPWGYRLVDREVVECKTREEAALAFGDDRILADTRIDPMGPWEEHWEMSAMFGIVGPGVHVSSVFLSIDHNHFDRGPPIVFESMIFGGPNDQDQYLYSTYDEAEIGHEILVEYALASLGHRHVASCNGGRTCEFIAAPIEPHPVHPVSPR